MKPLPRLQDMPFPIKRRIVGHLEAYYDKMSLRTACSNFHLIVGNPHFTCGILHVRLEGSRLINLGLQEDSETFQKTYIQEENGCRVIVERKNWLEWLEVAEHFVEGADFNKLAKQDFELIVDNPNFEINTFNVSKKDSDNIIFLANLTFILMRVNLKVKRFEMCYGGDQGDVIQILLFLNSESLKSLKLTKSPGTEETAYPLDEVMKLEQWRLVREIELFGHPKNQLPIELLMNNPNPHVELRSFCLRDLRKIIKHFRTAPHFREWSSVTKYSERTLVKALESIGTHVQADDDCKCAEFPRTPTKFSLEVHIQDDYIWFTRYGSGWDEERVELFEQVMPAKEDNEYDDDEDEVETPSESEEESEEEAESRPPDSGESDNEGFAF